MPLPGTLEVFDETHVGAPELRSAQAYATAVGHEGSRRLAQDVRLNAGAAVAFAMHPTSLNQLMAVADSGQVMPPKSTWFEPKLRSGLLVRTLDTW